jgi:NitT/TauT family transport system permease protein
MKFVTKLLKNQLLIGFLSVIFFWQLLYKILQTHAVASPLATFDYMWEIKMPILLHSIASIGRVLCSLFISLLIGIPIGILLGKSNKLNQFFSPFLYYIYPIPKVAFLPIFMLLYGLGNLSKIMLIIWIIVFQIIISVRDGVLQIPNTYYKVMKGFAAPIEQQVKHLLIPAMLPQLFSGLRISIGISLASLFFAENYATTYGIGYFILSAWTKMNYEEMFSGIISLGFIGLLMFMLLDKLEVHFTPWTNKKRRSG